MECILYPSLHILLPEDNLSECQYGGKCYNSGSKHQNTYRQPAFCPHNGYCRNMSDDHLLAYRHAPLCKYALQCHEREMPDHAMKYRHCNRSCSHSDFCVKFHNTLHIETLSHPFLRPCSLSPYNCQKHDEWIRNFPYVSNEILSHCYWFAHVCHLGRQCSDMNEEHLQTSVHVARNFCPHGGQCPDILKEDHLNSYSHIGLLDVRQPCKNGAICSQKHNQVHVNLYRHEDTDHFSVAPYFGFHENINYVKNQYAMLERLKWYTVSKGYECIIVPDDILNFVRVIQPMHRCKRDVFESILRQGHLMSLHYMEDLSKRAERVADQVWTQLKKMVEIHQNSQLEQTVYRFIRSLVQNQFRIVEKQSTNDLDDGTCDSIQFYENKLNGSSLNKEQIDTIRQCSVDVAKHSLNLCDNCPGIHHGPDKDFGTDKHVFGILGPNLGHRYGDIVIIFKRQIMLHPDTNFAIQAATTFGQSGNAYRWRPWLIDPGTAEHRIDQYYSNILHCSVPGYEYVAAAELIGITAKEPDINPNDVSLEQVIKRWMHANPQQRFETHLPALIPLDYIDHVYMPTNVFESLSPWAQKTANEVFGSLLTVT